MFKRLIAITLVFSSCSLSHRISPNPSRSWKVPDYVREELKPPVVSSDPLEALSDKVISLDEAINLALTKNPSTKQMWYLAKSAAANIGVARADLYPAIDFKESLQRSQSEIGGGIPAIRRTTESPSVELTYTLLDFGGRNAAIDAAKQSLSVANFGFNRSLQELVFLVQQRFFGTYAAEAAYRANELSLKDAQENLSVAETKLQVGMAPKQDVLKAQSNLQQAIFDLEAARAALEEARANLAMVLGIPVSEELKIYVAPFNPKPELSTKVQSLVEEAMAKRPDLLAARAQIKASENEELRVASAALPKLVSRGRADLTNVRRQSAQEENFAVELAIEVPVFSGFKNWYAYQRASAQTSAFQNEALAKELQVAAEVWSHYHGFSSSVKQHQAATARYSASAEAYRVIEEGYKNGVNSFLDLVSAQNDLAQARRSVASAEAQVSTSLAALGLAVGSLESSGEGS